VRGRNGRGQARSRKILEGFYGGGFDGEVGSQEEGAQGSEDQQGESRVRDMVRVGTWT